MSKTKGWYRFIFRNQGTPLNCWAITRNLVRWKTITKTIFERYSFQETLRCRVMVLQWQGANLQQSQMQKLRPGCRAGNHLLMGNTLLSIAQIVLCATPGRGGRHPGGDSLPEAMHDLKTGAVPRSSSCLSWKRRPWVWLNKYVWWKRVVEEEEGGIYEHMNRRRVRHGKPENVNKKLWIIIGQMGMDFNRNNF